MLSETTPFELFQSEIGLTSLIGFFAFLISFLAWKKKFFRFSNYPPSLSLSFEYVFFSFAAYLGINLFIAPLFSKVIQRFFKQSTHSLSSTVAWASWANLSVLLSVTFFLSILCFLLKRETFRFIWKWDYSNGLKSDILFGALSWIVAFPIILFIGQSLDLFVYIQFNVTEIPEQIAVQFLKMTLAFPIYFTFALISALFLAPFVEEILFRGILQSWLRKHLGRKSSILTSSLFFAFFHYAPSQGVGNIPILGSLFVLACFLGFIYEKRGALITPIVLHATFNGMSVLNLLFYKG